MRKEIFLIIAVALLAPASVRAQSSDDDLRVYAVGVSRAGPFIWPYSGYGIYLGESAIITAAHVVGHWPLFSNPTIIIAGREIEAKVIKKGEFPQLDLAQLSVEQASLPVSLRLRRNPLCKEPADVGTDVVVVSPDQTAHSQIIPPQAIAPQYRSLFGTLISEPHGSGSGVFDADKKCLVGIMSAAVMRNSLVGAAVTPLSLKTTWDDRVGYFVPASIISDFLPAHYRF
jgi:trypsin-like peptidase